MEGVFQGVLSHAVSATTLSNRAIFKNPYYTGDEVFRKRLDLEHNCKFNAELLPKTAEIFLRSFERSG